MNYYWLTKKRGGAVHLWLVFFSLSPGVKSVSLSWLSAHDREVALSPHEACSFEKGKDILY